MSLWPRGFLMAKKLAKGSTAGSVQDLARTSDDFVPSRDGNNERDLGWLPL